MEHSLFSFVPVRFYFFRHITSYFYNTIDSLCFANRIPPIWKAHKMLLVMQINRNRVLLQNTLCRDKLDKLRWFQWPMFLKEPRNDFARCPWLVPVFLKRIESASHKHKARVFNKFIMHCLGIG